MFMVSSTSSGDEQTDIDRVTAPMSAAPATSVPASNVSMPSMDTLLSRGGTDHPIAHESVPSNETGLSIRANFYASDHERLTASSGFPLIAANLEIHERAMPALASGVNSVAAWLDSIMDKCPLGALDWSQLVASDPLAAEIEAAGFTDTQGGQVKKSE